MSTARPEAMAEAAYLTEGRAQLRRDFQHLRSRWCWLFSFGILLVVCGVVAVVVPAATIGASRLAMIVLGVSLMVSGMATIVASFWAGKWSGQLPQLLVGILYLVAGYAISDRPLRAAAMMAAFVAMIFIILGIFRILAALMIRFPHWGWTLLNGAVTLLCGVVIYRHFPKSAIWVVGLLVGLELIFHGMTWIALSLAVRRIPAEPA